MNDRREELHGASEPRRPSGKQILAIVAGVVIVVWALLNLDDVRVDFLFADVNLPLFVVIMVSGLVGALIGMLVGRRQRERDE